jgi:hypothetical protein
LSRNGRWRTNTNCEKIGGVPALAINPKGSQASMLTKVTHLENSAASDCASASMTALKAYTTSLQ